VLKGARRVEELVDAKCFLSVRFGHSHMLRVRTWLQFTGLLPGSGADLGIPIPKFKIEKIVPQHA
jgi:hypothetical protein